MVVGDFPLSGKIAVVTGGGSGIGLSFVRLALQSSAKVLIADLRLTSEAEELVQTSKDNVSFMPCDVSKWSDLEGIPSAVAKAFGNDAVADAWVAGAGIFEPKWSSFFHDSEEHFYMQMRINAEHPIKLTRIAMRSCLGVNKPCVVLIISSGAGITGVYAAALYSASKHAVVGFTKSMAQADADQNVKVVCVCPGIVSTPLWTSEAAKDIRTQWSYADEICIRPGEVAEAMKEMIEQSKYKGGALMEVSKAAPRKVLEDPQNMDVLDLGEDVKAWLDRSYAPSREIFAKERGAVL